MFRREILQRKLLRVDLMHRAAAIRHSADLIGIEFFPINGLSFTIVLCVCVF